MYWRQHSQGLAAEFDSFLVESKGSRKYDRGCGLSKFLPVFCRCGQGQSIWNLQKLRDRIRGQQGLDTTSRLESHQNYQLVCQRGRQKRLLQPGCRLILIWKDTILIWKFIELNERDNRRSKIVLFEDQDGLQQKTEKFYTEYQGCTG